MEVGMYNFLLCGGLQTRFPLAAGHTPLRHPKNSVMMLRERAPNLTENLPSAAFKRHAHREAEDDFEAYRVILKSKPPKDMSGRYTNF